MERSLGSIALSPPPPSPPVPPPTWATANKCWLQPAIGFPIDIVEGNTSKDITSKLGTIAKDKRAVAKALEIAGPCQMPPSAGSVMKTIRVGAVDCAGSQAGKQVCEREGAIERLPSVRLYADGARDTLAGP